MSLGVGLIVSRPTVASTPISSTRVEMLIMPMKAGMLIVWIYKKRWGFDAGIQLF